MNDQTDPETNQEHRETGDWIARQFFTQADLQLSPEEYAARHAHLWGCFSLHQRSYTDPALGTWVRRLGEILASPDEVERCRHRFLSEDELAGIRRAEAEDL